MPLVLKKSFRERIKDLPVLIDDKSASSPNFFRVSDVPQLLTKGKNLLRITGHPTNLKEGTQILIDVRDSNGNDIYYEIPDYIEDDKSRLISIYIYHDKGDDNTPNGEAIITLIGVASKREDGRAIPTGYKGKHNVRWQTKVNVDRDRKSITPIIFNPTTKLPQLSISESIEVYKNQPHSGTGLNRITQTGKVRYIFKGKTPIAQITDSSVFNQEMVGSSIVLSSFTEPATPISKNEPTNSNFFSGSIGKVLNASTVQLKNPYIASFLEREGLKHSYDSIEESNYTIQYSRSGSNVTTENERSFVNLSFSDVDPIAGIVDKVKVLQKSDGLPGEFELLNEVAVPYSSSFSVKIPMPSENLQDPKLLKIQYLNSIGEISRTETLSQPFVFAGGNQYIGGSKNLISGSLFISNTLGTGLEIGGASSGFMRSVGFEGQTSASLGKAPGGFVIYSGSGNLQMGADTLEGVGMQMIGDNDDRHFIFSTANGGNLDVKTDKFFIGTNNTQFISGSNSNIEISSSLFHLDPKNNSLVIGANATILADLSVNNIFSPAGTNINSSKAAITAQGFAKFTSASIGGIKLDDNKLFTGDGTYSNSNTGFYVDSGSQFSLGNKLVWNPTTQALVIRGQLQLSDGSDVGNALAAATSSNTSKTVALGASSYVVTFNSLGNQDPTGQTITLTATQQNHTGTVYYEFRKGGSLQSARGTSNTFVADQSNELPSSTTPVTYEVKTFEVASGGSAIANDTLTLFGVTAASSGSDGSAGVDAVTAFLTNEAHSFAANPDKSIVSFVGGTTDMEVFEGVTNKTSQYTFTRASTTSVSSSISGKTVTITSMGHDSGSVVVTATKGSTSLSKTMSLVKAIAGQTGSDGSDGARGTDGTSAKLLIGSLDSQVFAFDNVADTSSDPLEIFFSFQQQNLTAAIVASDLTITTAGGSNITNFDFNNASISSGTGIVSGSIIFSQALNNGGAAGTKSNLPINISATKDGLQDSVKIFKIEGGTSGVDGQSARTMILTNESHTFASQPNGSIISFTGGDTDVSVFTGTTNTTSAYTISSTSTTSVSSSISSNTVTVTSMGHDSGSLIITAVSASGAAGEVSLSKLMSLTKAKQGTDGDDGAAGSNAKTITVNAASQIFVKAQNGTISPSSIVISANGQNLTSAGAFSTSAGTLTSKTENSSGGSATVTSGNFVDGMVVTYTTAGGDGSLTDSVTLKELDEGSGAVSALLTNESHVLPASSVGVVSSYSNSGTSIDVYEGATQLDYDGSGTTNGHWTIGTPTISPAGKITVGSISDSTNTAVVGNHSAMDNSTDSVTITYPISGKTQNGTAFSFNKTQTLTKSKAGTDGTNGTNGVNGTSAKLLTITPNSQVFGFDNSVDTTATPSSIIFTVAQQNLAHTIDTGDITITKAGSSTLSTPSLSGTISGGTGQQTFTVPFSSLTKTDLPLTVSVSNNANNLSDTTKIFKVVGGDTGSDGSAGTDAVSAFLTNEAHTFAALNNGNIVSFVGGSTDMEVFEGVTNVTSQYTISSSRGPGVVASDSGNTVTISALSHDSGSLTITATKGSTSLNKTMSLVKSKQGTAGLAGADAKSVSIVADSQTFAFDNSVDTTATPSSVNFVVNQQNLSGTIATSDITITKAGGATFTTPSLGGSVSSGTGTRTFALPFSSFSKSDLPLNIAVSKDSLSDSSKVFKIVGGDTGSDGSAGTDAVTAFLTNESHTFAADFSGSIASFTGGSTDMEVFEGVSNETSNYTISSSRGPGVTATDSGNTVTVTGMTGDVGSVKITATKGSTSLNKTMSLVKSKQGGVGATGVDGSNAKTVTTTAASQIFVKAQNGTISPSSIVISANGQNLTANGAFSTSAGTLTSTSVSTSGGSTTVTSANFVDGMVVTYTAHSNDGSLTDSITLKELDEGSGAVSALLTNESHVLPASSTGVVSSYSDSGTSIDVYEGATQLDYDGSGTSNGHWTIGTPTVSPSGKITVGSISDSTDTAVVANHSSMDNNTDSVTITYPISGKTQNGTSFSFNKTQTITKSKAGTDGDDGDDGAAGANAQTVTLNAASQIFVKAQNGDITPSSIVISANGQNLTQAGAFSTTAGTLTNTSTSANGGSTTVTSGNFSNGMVITYTAHSNDNSITDSVTLKELDEGSGAITALLENEAHVLPANSSGVVSSYSNSGTKISVFEGATALDYDGTGTADGHWTVSTSQSPSSTITIGSISDSTNDAVVANHSSMVNGTDSVTITYTISGKTLNGTDFSFTKTQTLTKSKAGATGAAGSDSKTVSLTAANNVITYNAAGSSPSPSSTITLTATSQNFTNGFFKFTGDGISDEGSFTDGSGANSDTFSFSVPSSYFSTPKSIRVGVSEANQSELAFDTVSIVAVQPGTDGTSGTDGVSAITAFLTSDGDIVPAANDGTVSSFAGSGTEMIIFQGATDVSSAYNTVTRTNSTGVTSALSGKTLSISGLTQDSGTVIITATSASGDPGQLAISKTYSIGKSKAGATGTAGSNAKTIAVGAASQIFVKAQDGTLSPNSIVISANGQNLTQAGAFSTTAGTLTSKTENSSGGSATVLKANFVNGMVVTYTTDSADGSLTDSVTLKELDAGSGTVSALLTNESHVLPASSAGVVSSYSNSGTSIEVYEGATQLDYDGSGTTNGHWTIGTPTVSPTNKITVGSISDSTDTAVVANHSSMDNSTDSVTITYPISGKTQNGTDFSFSKTQTITKSKAGSDGSPGSNAKTVTVGASSNIFVKAQDGTLSPSSITITANGQNLTANGAFSNTGGTLSSTSVSTSGGSTTVTSGNFSNGMVVTYTTAGADGSITDSVTLNELDEGSGNITAILDNEAHVLPASATGAVSSYANSGTTIRCFEGATALAFVTGTPGTGEFGVSVGNTANITEGSITDSGTFCTIGNHSGAADGTDQYVITYTISGKTLNGSDFTTFTKTQSLTKSKVGATGPQGNPGANNQDFSFLGASLTGIGPIGSAGLLMTSNVFGFHNGISGNNGALTDFTSFLDSSGNFYLGGNASGATNPTDGYFAWNNTDKSLLISGSKARIDVDKFFVGKSTTQFISGSNGNIEISSSKFHIKPDGDIIVKKVTADDGTIGGFTLNSTQINSSNNNLILKASGQVTASTLLLTGGSVAGMPVSSDEISVGEVLKLKQSGQITGSSVLFSGGNIGGFQLENSSLYQGIGGDLIASASFKIKPRFGDYGTVAPFEYEPLLGDNSFYISNISTNLPLDKLDLILKSGTILSASKGTTGTNNQIGMFQNSFNFHYGVVKSYDPVSKLLTLNTGWSLGGGANGTQANTRKIDVVDGVVYSSNSFNSADKTTSFTIPQKDVSNLILSSSGNFKAKTGLIGDFTITKTDIELISSIQSKKELFDFRVYNSTNWPTDAINNDLSSENGGKALVLNVGGEDWEVKRISNVGENNSNEGYGNYLAISASARSSSTKVYDQSQLEGLGMNVKNSQNAFKWPFSPAMGTGGLGYSYIKPTTNKFGKNESWYLEYFGGTSTIKSGDVGLESATITFMSESSTISKVEALVFAATSSFIGNNQYSPIILTNQESKYSSPISDAKTQLSNEGVRQSLYLDGLGGKGEYFGSAGLSNWLLGQTDSNKLNFWEQHNVQTIVHNANRTLPEIAGLSLSTELTIDKSILTTISTAISRSSAYTNAENATGHWNTANEAGMKLKDIFDSPFIYFGRELSPTEIPKLYSVIKAGFNGGNWANSTYNIQEAFEKLGIKPTATASINIMPYYPVMSQGFVETSGATIDSYTSETKYAANLQVEKLRGSNEREYPSFPSFISSSEFGTEFRNDIVNGDTPEITVEHIQTKNVDINGGSSTTATPTSHIMILAEGYYINPLLDEVLHNNGNGVNVENAYASGNGAVGGLDDTHKLEAENGAVSISNAYPVNWLRIGAAYDVNKVMPGHSVDATTRKLRGLPFKVHHNITSGSFTLGSKAILRNGIFPTDIDSRGKFLTSGSGVTTTQEMSRGFNDTGTLGPPTSNQGSSIYPHSTTVPLNLNGLLNSNFFGFGTAEGDIGVTDRISATVINTDASVNFQKAFFDISQKQQKFDMPFSLTFAEKLRFGDGTIRMGTLSGSFSRGSILKISGSGEISSSQYIQKSDGQVTGSKINFTGGRISGSDMTIFANEFDFKSPAGRVQGNETTFEISSSLLNLTPTKLDVKGNIQAERVYGQDTFLAGKIVETGVKNPKITSVKYSLPFVEAYSKDGNDVRLGSETDGFMMGESYNSSTTAKLVHTGSVIVGNHQSFTLGGAFSTSPQFLTKVTNDGIGYPEEFKSWKDISGVNNDYVFIENSDATTAARASGSLPTQLIGNQLVFNQVTSSKLIFNAVNAKTASNAFSTIETDNINLQDILSSKSVGTHLQFAMRGTAHPSTGSFSGFNPEYKVEVNVTSGSTSDTVWEKSYKDTKATNASWTVFDVPLTDIVTTWTSESKYNQHQYEFSRATQPPPSGSDVYGVKVKISSRYSGSVKMPQRFQEGKRFGGRNLASGSFTLGFALTEMRMVEPARIPALDVQNLHLKDTYLTWHDNPSTTGHYGNFVPEHRLENTTSSFALGSKNDKWDELYLNLKQDNIVSSSFSGSGGLITQKENKFVRMDVHSGKLSFTSASAGGGGSSYSHPTHPGDDINIDTTALTGATVISDLDFNITTDTSGHVTDANGTVATRTLTLANLGYTGATNANNFTYSLPLGTALTRGGFKIGYTESGKNYPVELSSEKMYVNVPWTDTNTDTNTFRGVRTTDGETGTALEANETLTLTAGTNVSISESEGTVTFSSTDTNTTYSVGAGGLTQENFTTTLKNKLDGIAASANNYSLPEATATVRGGIELFSNTDQSVAANTVSATAGRTYGLQLNSAGQAVVNVPWTNTQSTRGVRTEDGETGTALGSTETLTLKAGTNVSISESEGTVTISSTGGTDSTKLPLAGGSLTGTLTTVGINMANNTLSNVGQMSFNDPGPNEGISWTSGNTKIYESPDNLTTNSAGNLQFVYGTTRRMTINSTGADVNGVLTVSGNTTVSGDIYGKSVNNAYSNLYRFGGIYFTWDSDSYGTNFNHSITSTDNGVYSDDITINSFGHIRMNFDSNNNGTNTFSIGHHTTGTANTLFNLDESGNTTISSLSGTGNRMIIANASGVLSTQAIPSAGSSYSLNLSVDSSEASEVESGATIDFRAGSNVSLSKNSNQITIASTNTTYSADGNYGMALSGTAFRLEDDRRRNSTSTDVYSGNTHDYTFYDASVGIRWYTAGGEDMRLLDNGTLHVDGDVIAFSSTISDERLKDNIKTIENPLDKIKALRGVEYDWNNGNRKGKHDLGLIAQEVESVIPDIVHEHTLPYVDGEEDTLYKTVDYEKLTAVLIEAVKEQSDTIEKLTERINKLEKGSNN